MGLYWPFSVYRVFSLQVFFSLDVSSPTEQVFLTFYLFKAADSISLSVMLFVNSLRRRRLSGDWEGGKKKRKDSLRCVVIFVGLPFPKVRSIPIGWHNNWNIFPFSKIYPLHCFQHWSSLLTGKIHYGWISQTAHLWTSVTLQVPKSKRAIHLYHLSVVTFFPQQSFLIVHAETFSEKQCTFHLPKVWDVSSLKYGGALFP